MPSSQQHHRGQAQNEAATCETAVSLTQDFSRPASLSRSAQPTALSSALGLPLLYLRAGTLSAKLLLSGGVAGALSRTATAPVDRLKFLLQVQDNQAITIRQVQDQQLQSIQRMSLAPAFWNQYTLKRAPCTRLMCANAAGSAPYGSRGYIQGLLSRQWGKCCQKCA